MVRMKDKLFVSHQLYKVKFSPSGYWIKTPEPGVEEDRNAA